MRHPGPEKVVGILGGMGPEATVDLMQRIIRLTSAKDDIDHIRCLVDNNPKIPSRIKALIEGNGESPGPCMAGMAKNLESWGADFIVIPCNTAHYYHPEVQKAVQVPVLNIIELVVAACLRHTPGLRKAGLLASPAVRLTGLYERVFAQHQVEVVYPAPAQEELLLGAIRQVKAGDNGSGPRTVMASTAEHLAGRGAELAIIACTELSAIADAPFSIPQIDAAEVLAEAVVAYAKNQLGRPPAPQ